MEVLLQEARAPGAARAEVDALLVGLAQPMAPEQSPRERADLLLALIEDKHLGDFTGSAGRTVRSAAVQALLELGYPYALEVPPDALEQRSGPAHEAQDGSADSLFSSLKGWAGLSIIGLIGLAQLIPGLYFASMISSDSTKLALWVIAIVCGTTFVPVSLVALGHSLRSRLLRGVGNIWLVLAGLLWLLPGLFALTSSVAGLIPVVVGILFIVAVALMDTTAPSQPE